MSIETVLENNNNQYLGLNRFLNHQKISTFFYRVDDDSMSSEGIKDGDFLAVNRTLPEESGELVIAELNNKLTLRRLIIKGKQKILRASNPYYPDLNFKANEPLTLWGVVNSNRYYNN